ncbi:DNA repair exonuclease [Lactobacillus sp. ESL0679]|uniref:metallophosphoesterase family protein n=1 Tax=Lactobacillus sp. ESL0679 TaxID=2983209 RepID=UPI0023F94BFA|nr:DNA repair exonuclease [Lactobacillus sp. ESL0679]MDF7683060.1 DNA repair exonuclease [Lactobacillus sp. ESL0679]
MKFIHFADAHLDSPFLGLSFLPSKRFSQIQQAPNQSLSKIVDLALAEQVDLVLIAGDTFDSSRPNPGSQLFLADQIKRLTDAQIQVVMIFGNHDHMWAADLLVPDSPYFKLLGDGEQVETVSCQTRSGFDYDVSGFSYLNNHITSDLVPNFPAKTVHYTFGMMHAQERAGQVSQNVYAPFNLSELKSLNYDYFALGHIHLRQILSETPLIVYPGNIQGRHINELGVKGCYLGIINEQTKKTQIKFMPTSPIVWAKATLTLTAEITPNDLRMHVLASLKPESTTYYSLQIIGAEYLNDQERELVQDTNYWQGISRELAFESQLVDVRFTTNSRLEIAANDQAYFTQAAEELFDPETFAKLGQDWIKKDELAAILAQDPQFLQEVKELAAVKLNNNLKGINDETD